MDSRGRQVPRTLPLGNGKKVMDLMPNSLQRSARTIDPMSASFITSLVCDFDVVAIGPCPVALTAHTNVCALGPEPVAPAAHINVCVCVCLSVCLSVCLCVCTHIREKVVTGGG